MGPSGLASDRPIRLLGLRRNAERHAKLLSPEARDFLLWYAEGMNAYITGHVDDHPLELRLAGFTPLNCRRGAKAGCCTGGSCPSW